MSGGGRITEELSLGELISETFDSYRKGFAKYFAVFLAVYVIIGILATLVARTVVIPTLPKGPTVGQVQSWASAEISFAVLSAIVVLIFGSIAQGTAIKLASAGIENEQVGVWASLRFTISKLLSIWVLEIIVGVIVILGLIALVVPGIILAIMFSLVLPVLLIENPGVIESLGRSRELVGGRWLKTFAFLLVLGIIVSIASLIGNGIGSLFGSGSTFVSDLVSALYTPILPIGLTVYYHSNAARIAPHPPVQAPAVQAGMKFCSNCGVQLESSAAFCPKCGAKQPV